MHRLQPVEKDYYLEDEGYYDVREEARDSDSSDDEIQQAMAKIANVPVRHSRTHGEQKNVSDFESDIDEELTTAFNKHTNDLLLNKGAGTLEKPMPSKVVKKGAESQIDPSLGLGEQKTDSDDEFMDEEGLSSEPKDDDLFYDPNEDDVNEEWILKHRKSQLQNQSTQKPPSSDAVLNCPACMSLLCLDCQRHSIYKTQYRAMFVQNCKEIEEEFVFMPSGPSRIARKRRLNKNPTSSADTSSTLPKPNDRISAEELPNCLPEDLFHPVQCQVCNTEVGVLDHEQIYHFFNVLSSYT